MKRVLLNLVCTSLVLSLPVLTTLAVEASPATLHVPDDYLTIQAAVDAASPGDTIIARDGTYTENVDVNKEHLTIESENGANSTIVQAANPYDHVFEVTADYVNISGFTVRGATGNDKAGMYSYNNPFSVSDLTLSDNNYGIYIYSTPHSPLRVSASTFSSNNYGIYSWSSYSSRYGEMHVSGSTFSDNNYGIYTSDFCGTNISNSDFLNNDYGIYGNNRMSIHAEYSIFSNNTYGIYGDSIWGINSLHSSFDNNDYSVYAVNGWDNTLSISYSDFRSNRWGIYYRASTLSSHVVFLNNFIDNASNVDSSTSEYIWNSPGQMTYTYNGKTYTSYLGNYWSRYTGTDIDGDGIGDTPYGVDGNKDDYPLMGLWEDGTIKAHVLEVDSTHSTVEATPTSVPADSTSTVTITTILRDSTGTLIKDGRTAQVTSNRPEDIITAVPGYESWTSDSNGIFQATLKSNLAGDAIITVIADGVELSQKPVVSFAATEVGQVILTQPLHITPSDTYFVRDYLTATFTVKNIGNAAITLDKLLLGGRFNGEELPSGGYPDFTHESVTLQPGDTHRYEGTFTIPEPGSYDFFIAYYIENPTEAENQFLDENNWNTTIELGEGLTDADRTKHIIAGIFEKELKVSFIVDPSPAPYLPLPVEWASAHIIVTYEQYEDNKDKFWLREINYEYDGDLVGYSQISLTSSTGEPLPWRVTIGTAYKQETFYPDITVYSTDKIELYTAGIPALSYEDLLLDVMNPVEIFRSFGSRRAVNSMTLDPLDIPKDPYQEKLKENYGPYIETADAEMIQIGSPGELRVYDSQGNLTGVVEGNMEEGIPSSLCTENRVIIFFANDTYAYEVVGIDEGKYDLKAASIQEGEVTNAGVTDVPTSDRAVHRYTIDWDALRRGEPSMDVQIDADGDKTFEQIKIVQLPIASFAYSPMSPVTTEQMTFDASESYDVDGAIISYEWDFGDGGTSSGGVVSHTYSTPGDHRVKLSVVDDDGAISNYSRMIQVREKEGGLPAWIWIPIGLAVALLGAAFVAWHRMILKQAVKLRA